MPDAVYELLVAEAELAKLGAHDISAEEVAQLRHNRYLTLRKPHGGGGQPGSRRFLIGQTSGCRVLTLVIEQTIDRTTWLIVTGWSDGARAYPARDDAMSTDPWTSDDPQPGDLDDVLAAIDPKYVESHEGDPTPTLRILVSVEGEDALRLERIAGQLGKTPHDVVSDLLRDADRSAA